MNIPPYPRPSSVNDVVHFRTPTVEDGLLFCELNEEQEEQNTTQFLNHIQNLDKQGGKLNDSLYWTGEDRRTALWWIFIATQELPTAAVSYECEHCKEEHYLDVNLAELANTATAVKALPKSEITCFIAGEQVSKIKVQPLNGAACEHIETLRNIRDQYAYQSIEWRKADTEMTLTELVHCLTFPNQPSDQDEALNWKLERIKGMALDTEFRTLYAQVESELRTMRHGIMTQYKDGRFLLVSNQKNCSAAVEAGEDQSKLLLLPFRHNDFIPTL
ncbi:hypothetical protein [Vibrio marisflavi]|uniref:PmgB n=1 Tax=Vibrio marisflavi CECT 7928 TaxID=634439 RepID=A0ABN8EBI2_9VIBR|nr:hypothetical protein [Vibrio marisflavi]CAH0543054.1 hypothetical protein VMF7928_04379 [Vibrio marisflavi CECT 7928]